LEHWNITGEIHKIQNPTLITGGKYDTMVYSILKVMQNEIKGSQLKIFPHSGHMTMIDDADLYNQEL